MLPLTPKAFADRGTSAQCSVQPNKHEWSIVLMSKQAWLSLPVLALSFAAFLGCPSASTDKRAPQKLAERNELAEPAAEAEPSKAPSVAAENPPKREAPS